MKPVPADDNAIEKAVEILRQGGLVAFPTETVYGLGANAADPEAVKRIFKAKGRPADHPLIVHIADLNQMSDWALTIPEDAIRLTELFWPGPLALILNKKPEVPLEVTGGQNTVALRIPDHPVALRLLQKFGGGIAAPSANRFCRISPTQAAHVAEELGNSVDLILDGGACQVGVESTIIDFTDAKPSIIRPGRVSQKQLETFLRTQLSPNRNVTIRAPGLMDVHYAPAAAALLFQSNELTGMIRDIVKNNKKAGLLVYSQKITRNDRLNVIYMPKNADAYAQVLYTSLRELDRQQPDFILVEQPPGDAAWSAVNDRLAKATLIYSAATCRCQPADR